MKIAVSDLADRYSILLLKRNKGKIDISSELNMIRGELNFYPGIDDYIIKLYDVNGFIWDLEADIRQGKEKELGLEEVGRRALKIRDYNNERIKIKNEIVNKYGEGFTEIKTNHASEN